MSSLGLNALTGGLNAANNSIQSTQSDRIQGAQLDPTLSPDIQESYKGLAPSAKQAQEGLQQAADITAKNQGTEGAQAYQQAQDMYQRSVDKQKQDAAISQWNKGMLINDMQKAQDAQAKLDNMAPIDPEKYVKDMGVSDKILTSIGMLMSGIGSGMSGQENLAFKQFNNNIQRSIDAQAQNYQNAVADVASAKGLAITDQDRLNIDNMSYQVASVQQLSAISKSMEAIMYQTYGDSAPASAKQALFQVQQQLQNSQQNLNALTKQTLESGDDRKMNALGTIFQHTYKSMSGDNKGIGQRIPTLMPKEAPAKSNSPDFFLNKSDLSFPGDIKSLKDIGVPPK